MLNNNLLHSPDRLVKIAVWLRSLGIVFLLLWLAGWVLVILGVWNTFLIQDNLHPDLSQTAQMIEAAMSSAKYVLGYLAAASTFLTCWGASEGIYLLLDIEFNTRGKVNDD